MSKENTIRVAIIGGGPAGTLIMNALIRHPQFDVNLYEAKPSLQERGASVGLSINAQRALRLLGQPFDELTKRAHAVRVGCLQLIVAGGPDEGKLILDVDSGKETVHRAALLRELLALIPKDHIHVNKKVTSIDGDRITFDDSTTVEADVVIGADGIHSGVRKFVLGEDNPHIAPVPAGFWDMRTLVSRDQAIELFGSSCIDTDDPHQHIHIGSKGIILHDVVDKGETFCILISGPNPPEWDTSQWSHTVSREWLYEQYADWEDYGRKAVDIVLGDKKEIRVYLQWESAETATLYNGRICMIGDAGHACSPWQGTGLSQAIEDTLVLETVMSRCRTLQQIPFALQAFDQVRRQHGQETVESSRRAGQSYFSAWPGGVEQLRKDIPSRQYILNWDTEGAMAESVKIFEQLQSEMNGHATNGG